MDQALINIYQQHIVTVTVIDIQLSGIPHVAQPSGMTKHNTEKNGFVTATELGTTKFFLLLQSKILLQQPNVLLTELNIVLL